MKKPRFTIKDWNDNLDFVECEVLGIQHKMFDMFSVHYINPEGEEKVKLSLLKELIPKNEEAEKIIKKIVDAITDRSSKFFVL
jgi:hypothetical protein